MPKLITVFGATGNQGGSVVKAFLADPEWTVRAITRDPSKPHAQALAAKGAELVAADMDDKASLEKAVAGSFAVFGVTNYWEYLSGEKELQQGKNLADAVKAAGVQFFVFSSLPNVAKLSNGVLQKVYHFDFKAKVQDYIQSIGIPAAYYQAAFFYQNFIPGKSSFLRNVDGKWVVAFLGPSTHPVAFVNISDDSGTVVKAMVDKRDHIAGQVVAGISRIMTFNDVIAGMKQAFPNLADSVSYRELDEAEFKAGTKAAGLPDFVVEEMYENAALIRDYRYFGPDEDALFQKTLDLVGDKDKLTDFVSYLKAEPGFAPLRA